MIAIDRLLLSVLVLAVGALAGYLLRHRLRPTPPTGTRRSGLREGLVVVTAPYCTRCTSLQRRLTAHGIEFVTVDAATRSDLLAELGVSTAPTLLRVDAAGRITDREHRDFSDGRLSALASTDEREAG